MPFVSSFMASSGCWVAPRRTSMVVMWLRRVSVSSSLSGSREAGIGPGGMRSNCVTDTSRKPKLRFSRFLIRIAASYFPKSSSHTPLLTSSPCPATPAAIAVQVSSSRQWRRQHLRWADDFLEKYAFDGTSKLKDHAAYHEAHTKGLLSFPSDIPPVTDLLATLIAVDGPAFTLVVLMTVLSLEQRGRILLKRWQPRGSRLR